MEFANTSEKNANAFPVGVIARHDVFSVLYFWAVLISGNYYIPIDPNSPKDKLNEIIKESDIRLILGRDADEDIIDPSMSISFFSIDENTLSNEQTNIVSVNGNEIDKTNKHGDDEKPAYMVYTSGSTGKPKGIVKSHAAVSDFINAYIDTFDFSSDEIIGCQTPFFFDASAKDIYLATALGATLEIIPEGMFTMPPALIRYLNEKKISFISWVPSALSIITQLNTFEEVIPETIKKIFFVGESFPIKQFNKWRSALPDVSFVNLYGASELAGICCFYPVPEEFDSKDRIPIGKPLKNCEVLLMDNSDDENISSDTELSCHNDSEQNANDHSIEKSDIITEAYKTGEIYISSKALFSGYFKDPDGTKKHFSEISGKKYFKTGDLAWYDNNGDLNFVSRNDGQIKHMGQRIELGEIETVCSSLNEISKTCCLYDSNKKRIYLFCELSEGTSENAKSLLLKLKPLLSSYMMPQRVVIKDRLPLNSNGKTDRQLLAKEMS